MKSNSVLTNLMQSYVDRGEIAGAALRIRVSDEVVFDHACGYADIGKKKKVDKDTMFRLASMTKPIIAVAVMILVEEGKIVLDEPLASYLPSYSDILVNGSTNPISKYLTIRTMLNHSCGMGERPDSSERVTEIFKQPDTLDNRVEKLSGLELDFIPGMDTGYSAQWAYGSHFYADPKNKLQMVLMINRANIGGADSYISKELEYHIYRNFCQ